ncbi:MULTISPECIES: hypothetical protein [Cupriavidus]
MTGQTNRHSTSTGSARLRFHCMGQPIAGLRFRLRLDSGEVHAGRSDAEGHSHLFAFGPARREESSADTVWLPAECDAATASIEIRRDDGSWKAIGQFRLDARHHKEISAEANAYALPFHLGRVDIPLAESTPPSVQGGAEPQSLVSTQSTAGPLPQNAIHTGPAAAAMPATYAPSAPPAYATFPQVLAVAQQPNGVLVNTYQAETLHWLKLALQMNTRTASGATTIQGVSNLPYVIVRSDLDSADRWQVVKTGRTGSGNAPVITIPVNGSGMYRLYIREPTVTYTNGVEFTVPRHALSSGELSDREVQPWYALTVTEGVTPNTLTVTRALPNALGRAGSDYSQPGSPLTLTNAHTSQNNALSLGTYLFTYVLWGDISQAYGANHPAVTASPHRAALERIYREDLTANGTTLVLTVPGTDKKVYFVADSTNGGSGFAKSFLHNGPMSRQESLRRTHPKVMAFLLEAMQILGLHYVRITGVWRPHTGSTRHRYASALDITHIRTMTTGPDGMPIEVKCHFNLVPESEQGANPLGTEAGADAQRRRVVSLAFHRYLAERRQAQELGWLGGPWPLTYAQVGLTGASRFIETNDQHVHHVHISVGIDQS